MALPVTGPVYTSTNLLNLYTWKNAYKQARPLDRALPYEMHRGVMTHIGSGTEASSTNTDFFNLLGSSEMIQLKNKVYDRLQDEILSGASLGAALAERHQSTAMIAKRAGELFSFAKAVRRFDFVSAAHVLRSATIPKGVSKGKSFANNWLEWSFGWKPLIKDIYTAVDVLQDPFLDHMVRASGKTTFRFYERYDTSISYQMRSARFDLTCKTGAAIRITNPNLFLANKLGLANPASVVWEIIPFSFVVDWFVNVGQFLSQGSNLLGLTALRPWQTLFAKGTNVRTLYNQYWADPATHVTSGKIVHMRRLDSLVKVQLKLQPTPITGWGRAANAISVLVQQMGRR